ncbi:MAG: CHAT domain-containing protein [Bacteroidota bacterium]
MKKIIYLFICVFSIFNVTLIECQNIQLPDTLKSIFPVNVHDTTKIRLCTDLVLFYSDTKPDSAFYYYNSATEIVLSCLSGKNDSSMTRIYKHLYSNILRVTGTLFSKQGDLINSVRVFNMSLNLDIELNDEEGIAVCYNTLGILSSMQGDFEGAIEYFKQLMSCYRNSEKINELKKMSGAANAYTNLGIANDQLSNYEIAINYYKKALKIYQNLNDNSGISRVYSNLGMSYGAQGSFDKAIEYYSMALQENIDKKNKRSISFNYLNIGNIYYKQGNFEKAKENFEFALEIAEELGDNGTIAKAYSNIGVVYKELKNVEKTEEYYKMALDYNIKQNNKKGISTIYNNYGTLYAENMLCDKALEYYLKSFQIKENINDKHGTALINGSIANLYTNLADTTSVLNNRELRDEYLRKALEYQEKEMFIAKETGLKTLEIIANSRFSRIYKGLNDFKKAKECLLKLIEMTNDAVQMNFSFISEKEKEIYYKSVEENYTEFNSFVLDNKKIDSLLVCDVFNNTIRNKGLLLKSSTAMRTAILNSNDSILIEEFNSWINLKKEISKLQSVEIIKRKADLDIIKVKADSLERELVKKSQIFSNFYKVQFLNWQMVRDGLSPGEAAVEFINFKYQGTRLHGFTDTVIYCALIVKPESKFPEMIRIFNEMDLISIMGKYTGTNISYIDKIYGKSKKYNKDLYNLIWEPIEHYFQDSKVIYISPSGLLHKISFAAIPIDQNILLCDNYEIKTLTNTGLITTQTNEPFENNSYSIFGGINYNTDSVYSGAEEIQVWSYLEGTKTETVLIKNILKKEKAKVNLYTSSDATEAEFKIIASESNVLHIATHGFFFPEAEEIKDMETEENSAEYINVVFRSKSSGFGSSNFIQNNNPLMRTGLVLSGANDVWNISDNIDREDGILTAQEVTQLNMTKTKLVVLSACETGLGDIKGSEGVYGLQRAFKMAGVKYIIMSLWQVPDKETVEFMEAFYKKLLKLKDIRKAFLETQKEMRKKYDPYFWAAFVLIE